VANKKRSKDVDQGEGKALGTGAKDHVEPEPGVDEPVRDVERDEDGERTDG
jgi:hypothetical protein